MIYTPLPGVSNAMVVRWKRIGARVEVDAKYRSRRGKKRNLGSFVERVDQHGDSKATTSMPTAFPSVAIACDKSHCPGLTEGQPRDTISCIAVNQIANPLPQGGRMKASERVCLRTQVTIIGRDKESVKWALGDTFRASKHGESPTHERIDLFQGKESKKVLTTIDQLFEEEKQARQQPSKNFARVMRLETSNASISHRLLDSKIRVSSDYVDVCNSEVL
jgi:hypothetical protein